MGTSLKLLNDAKSKDDLRNEKAVLQGSHQLFPTTFNEDRAYQGHTKINGIISKHNSDQANKLPDRRKNLLELPR